MKRIVKSQPVRKKLWWLLFLAPLLYVIVDNLIYPIDESKILKRVEYEEAEVPEVTEEAMTAEDDGSSGYYPPPPPESAYPDGHTHTGWEIYDMIWARIEKAWPVLFSLIMWIFRRKAVGDNK